MISFAGFKRILEDEGQNHIENLARKARALTQRYFGRTVSLYAPLYISNFCDSRCLYCGFRSDNRLLQRTKLSIEEMESEMKYLADRGIQSVLLLTGESRRESSPEYIYSAIECAKRYFSSIHIEVYPLEEEEYKTFFNGGVDGVTLYQETYDKSRYSVLHPAGKKRDYSYRKNTLERIARSGIRFVSMGVLLGLHDVAEDVYQLFKHLEWMQSRYPSVEYALSFPRINPVGEIPGGYVKVDDKMLVKLMCLARIFFPRVGINLSTRETDVFRDSVLGLGVTRISAASSTKVGGYAKPDVVNTQFDTRDKRSVDDIMRMLKKQQFDPVLTDWRRIE